jgi:hypothetical protein
LGQDDSVNQPREMTGYPHANARRELPAFSLAPLSFVWEKAVSRDSDYAKRGLEQSSIGYGLQWAD